MGKPKFRRQVIVVEILSYEENSPEFESLAEVAHDIEHADYSGKWEIVIDEEVSRTKFDELVEAHVSDTSFFGDEDER